LCVFFVFFFIILLQTVKIDNCNDYHTWTNQKLPRHSRMLLSLAISSAPTRRPPSHPPLAWASAPARAKARRYRSLSLGAGRVVRRHPLDHLSLCARRQRPHTARPPAPIGTALTEQPLHPHPRPPWLPRWAPHPPVHMRARSPLAGVRIAAVLGRVQTEPNIGDDRDASLAARSR
jgi:hypothetical protein